MNSPSQEDLLGYLLGALDAREQEQVQQLVDQQPHLEAKLLALKASLATLEQIDEPVGPPPGLARRCCQFVAVSSRQLAREEAQLVGNAVPEELAEVALASAGSDLASAGSALASAGSDLASAGASGLSGGWRGLGRARFFAAREEPLGRAGAGWSLMDVVCSCAAALLVGALLLPALSAARFNSRLVACQDNLRTVFNSLTQYAEAHEGRFPQIPQSGPLSAAGYVGPILKAEGLLDQDRVFACAGKGAAAERVRIPSTSEILAAETPEELRQYRQRMLGDYGYTLGFLENGKYGAPKSLGSGSYVLFADAPQNGTFPRISRNHGGWGQNCLMSDGSIQFNRTGCIGNDAIYLNDRNIVAPGIGPLDTVVAPAHVEPFPTFVVVE